MGIFDLFYKSKEAKDYCRDVKLFDEKDLEQINKISSLEAENKRLRKALEFYAFDGNYIDKAAYEMCSIMWDHGDEAHEALKKRMVNEFFGQNKKSKKDK